MNSINHTLKLVETNLLTYEELAYSFSRFYTDKNGNSKFLKIHKKVKNSSKISLLIYKSLDRKIVPEAIDYLGCLHEIPYFLVARSETVAIAAILTLERWNQEVNSKYNLCSLNGLREIAEQILRQSK